MTKPEPGCPENSVPGKLVDRMYTVLRGFFEYEYPSEYPRLRAHVISGYEVPAPLELSMKYCAGIDAVVTPDGPVIRIYINFNPLAEPPDREPTELSYISGQGKIYFLGPVSKSDLMLDMARYVEEEIPEIRHKYPINVLFEKLQLGQEGL